MTRRTTVVLVGAGHAHLFVASRAETLVAVGACVVLIEPAEFWYSGLANGMLGGMYSPDEDRLDPRTLIEAHGGEFVRGCVESVDTDQRRIRLADKRELAYDLLSINVGSRVPIRTELPVRCRDGLLVNGKFIIFATQSLFGHLRGTPCLIWFSFCLPTYTIGHLKPTSIHPTGPTPPLLDVTTWSSSARERPDWSRQRGRRDWEQESP